MSKAKPSATAEPRTVSANSVSSWWAEGQIPLNGGGGEGAGYHNPGDSSPSFSLPCQSSV